MDNELEGFIEGLKGDNSSLQAQNNELRGAMSSQVQQDKNLIEFQLDTKELIENIEHYLKGEVIGRDEENEECWILPKINVPVLDSEGEQKKDEEGNLMFEEVPDENLIVFNEYGVSAIMLTLQQYITKETKLSIYKEQRIYEIMAELGDALRKYLFCNYEKMGLTTEFKKSKYPMIVITLLNMIETAYRNSIDGITLKESNTGRNIIQNEGNKYSQQPIMASRPRRGLGGLFGFGR